METEAKKGTMSNNRWMVCLRLGHSLKPTHTEWPDLVITVTRSGRICKEYLNRVTLSTYASLDEGESAESQTEDLNQAPIPAEAFVVEEAPLPAVLEHMFDLGICYFKFSRNFLLCLQICKFWKFSKSFSPCLENCEKLQVSKIL